MPQSTPPPRPPRPPSHRPHPRQQDFLEIGDEDELDQGYGQDPRYSQSARHTPRQPDFGEEYEAEFYGQKRNPQHRQDPAYRPQGRPQPARQAQNYPRYPEDYPAGIRNRAAQRNWESGQPQRTQKKDWRTWVALAALIPALGLAFTIEAPTPLVNWLIAIVAIVIAGVFAWRKDVIKSKSYR